MRSITSAVLLGIVFIQSCFAASSIIESSATNTYILNHSPSNPPNTLLFRAELERPCNPVGRIVPEPFRFVCQSVRKQYWLDAPQFPKYPLVG